MKEQVEFERISQSIGEPTVNANQPGLHPTAVGVNQPVPQAPAVGVNQPDPHVSAS